MTEFYHRFIEVYTFCTYTLLPHQLQKFSPATADIKDIFIALKVMNKNPLPSLPHRLWQTAWRRIAI